MKKNIFLISMTMLALISCTNDEVIQINNGQKIDFHIGMETRATVLDQGSLNEFYVTALTEKGEPYFSDIKFTKGNDNYFTSAKEYYWPSTGDLHFFAYYPSAETLGSTISITEANKTLTGYTPSAEISEQLDFITAKTVGNKANNSTGVALEFNHQLSQIEIKGLNKNEGYIIDVKAISIRNVIKTGDFDFGLSLWNLNSDEEDIVSYDIEFSNAIRLDETAQSLMGDEGNAMLIPQKRPKWIASEATTTSEENGEDDGSTGEGEASGNEEQTSTNGSYLAFKIRVTTESGVLIYPLEGDENLYAWVAYPLAFDWEPGYKYSYNCDFTDGLGVIAPNNPDNPDNPYNPGDEVYGGKIAVDVDFETWSTNNNSYPNIDMKPQEPQAPDAGEGDEGDEE